MALNLIAQIDASKEIVIKRRRRSLNFLPRDGSAWVRKGGYSTAELTLVASICEKQGMMLRVNGGQCYERWVR